jgi:endonuclease/exonuclease/phosphatase family metal-dependent hydrolase
VRNLILVLLLFLSSCSRLSWGPDQSLIVMTYNVENLFDADHDDGKQDWAYLPAGHSKKRDGCLTVSNPYWQKQCFETDWTPEKLEIKLDQISRVVNASSKRRPHFLGLTEVENEKVVGLLAQKLDYQHFVVSDGPDQRGVDVALLYRPTPELQFIRSNEHLIISDEKNVRPTRPILEVEFSWRDQPLWVYVNHWPAQGNPNSYRVQAARVLRELIDEKQKLDPRSYIIAMGDFNVIESNSPHAVRDILLKDSALFDVHSTFLQAESISKKRKSQLAPGTYYFARDKVWNNLDLIILSQNFQGPNSGLKVDLESFDIVNKSFMTRNGVPWRYDHNASNAAQAGFSDHLPIKVELRTR